MNKTLYWLIGGGAGGYLLLMILAILLLRHYGCAGGGGGAGGHARDGGGAADQGDPYAGRRATHVGNGRPDSVSSSPEPAKPGAAEPEAEQPEETRILLTNAPIALHFDEVPRAGNPDEKKQVERPTARSPAGAPGGGSGNGPYAQRGARSGHTGMGATPESEAAVDAGLLWLANVQHDDGHWDENLDMKTRGKNAGCGQHSTGLTALGVLAFLGAGHVPAEAGKLGGTIGEQKVGPYGEKVRKAIEWLLARQRNSASSDQLQRGRPIKEKTLGPAKEAPDSGRFEQDTFYEQGLATMALCEAYGMTRNPKYSGPAQRALDCIVRNMGQEGGYGYGGPGDDTHVVSTQVMALKSGKLAGLHVPPETMVRLLRYFDDALDKDGTTGYSARSRGGGTPTGARTAVGLFCRIFLECSLKDPKVQQIANLLDEVGPRIGDTFQTYYGTYAMFQIGGTRWDQWNRRFSKPVIAMQISAPEEAKGSWRGGYGQVCATCLYIMALEVYYRYLPVNK